MQDGATSPLALGCGSKGRGIGVRKYNRNMLDALGAMPSVSASEAIPPETKQNSK